MNFNMDSYRDGKVGNSRRDFIICALLAIAAERYQP